MPQNFEKDEKSQVSKEEAVKTMEERLGKLESFVSSTFEKLNLKLPSMISESPLLSPDKS